MGEAHNARHPCLGGDTGICYTMCVAVNILCMGARCKIFRHVSVWFTRGNALMLLWFPVLFCRCSLHVCICSCVGSCWLGRNPAVSLMWHDYCIVGGVHWHMVFDIVNTLNRAGPTRHGYSHSISSKGY